MMLAGAFRVTVEQDGSFAVPGIAGIPEGTVLVAFADVLSGVSHVRFYREADYQTCREKIAGSLASESSEEDVCQTGRMIDRLLNAAGFVCTVEKGSIALPETLRAQCALSGPCMLVGAIDHLELYSERAWEDALSEIDEQLGAES